MIIQEGSNEEIANSVKYQDINTCEKGPYLASSVTLISSLKAILLAMVCALIVHS
jgi:hypothetical protein